MEYDDCIHNETATETVVVGWMFYTSHTIQMKDDKDIVVENTINTFT